MTAKIQIFRTETPDKPPTALLPGELCLEMASNPARLWGGVPTSIDPAGMKLINGGVIVADLPPSVPTQGLLWLESDTMILWVWYVDPNGGQWVQAAGSSGGAQDIWVYRAGDTMTGLLKIQMSNPSVVLNRTGVGDAAAVWGNKGDLSRWAILPGTQAAENGLNTGSDFAISRYDDAGTFIEQSITIFRDTGRVRIPRDLEVQGNFYINPSQDNRWQNTGNLVITAEGYKPVAGDWAAASDVRIKTVLGDYTKGLATIKQINPVRFEFKGNVSTMAAKAGEPPTPMHKDVLGKEFIGLLAQEAESSMPEMVTQTTAWIDGQEVNDLRILNTTALTYALINAVKELSTQNEALTARIAALEGAR